MNERNEKMESEKKCVLLAERIRDILGGGLKICSDVLHYIDSTFSNPSAKVLEEVIRNESDCEMDSLLELIFFPDESLQILMEDILETENFEKQDEEKVAESLFSHGHPQTTLYFPDNRGVLNISMPQHIADSFISRLNISKKPDQRVVEAINIFVGEPSKKHFKVKLRNARFVPTENKISFMCCFFEKMDTESREIVNCLDFILNFFDELRDDTDIFQSLMDKKRFYFQNLQKATEFEEKLKKSNMETLILQGVRTPYINKPDTMEKIAMIDTVSLAVFSRTEHPGQACRAMNLGDYQGAQDIDRMAKVLLYAVPNP